MAFSRSEKESMVEIFKRLGIREEDLVEKFIRSAGPGGQNVNKTSTCVYLKHLPTGIEVKCQKERLQAQNRILAREILAQKITELRRKELSSQIQLEEKLRRQQRKRSHRVKLKILQEKRRHAQKKLLRSKIRHPDAE
jgi:protein subunit release factor B